jgi:hypothetical protein
MTFRVALDADDAQRLHAPFAQTQTQAYSKG